MGCVAYVGPTRRPPPRSLRRSDLGSTGCILYHTHLAAVRLDAQTTMASSSCPVGLSNKLWVRDRPDRMNTLSKPAANTDSLASFLTLKVNRRFVYIPNPGNAGDALIAFATLRLFCDLSLPPHDEGNWTLAYSSQMIVMGGGGSLVERASSSGPFGSEKIAQFLQLNAPKTRNNTIVLLPQSVRGYTSLLGGLGGNVWIWARERETYKHLRKFATGGAHVFVGHDVALHLVDCRLWHTASITAPARLRAEPSLVFRTDREAPADQKRPSRNVDIVRACANKLDIQAVNVSLLGLSGELSRNELSLCAKAFALLRYVAAAPEVRTNRLHVAIAALITCTPCHMYDNSYGTLSSVFAHSLSTGCAYDDRILLLHSGVYQPSPSPSHGFPLCEAAEGRSPTFLQLVVSPFQGSTALLSLLMSSAHVATLCPARTWQCEGTKVAQVAGVPEYDNLLRSVGAYRAAFTARLRAYGRVWNMSKAVLVDKSPNPTFENIELIVELARQYEPFTLPGVQTLHQAYILMWTPWCVWNLLQRASNSTRYRYAPGSREYGAEMMQRALFRLENVSRVHQWLLRADVPSLVISYGDLLWDPSLVAKRVLRFLPCLGSVDSAFVPSMGVHVFAGNQWKANGSLKEYGALHPPEPLGYSRVERRCVQTPSFDTASIGPLERQELMLRFQTANEHLHHWSGHGITRTSGRPGGGRAGGGGGGGGDDDGDDGGGRNGGLRLDGDGGGGNGGGGDRVGEEGDGGDGGCNDGDD